MHHAQVAVAWIFGEGGRGAAPVVFAVAAAVAAGKEEGGCRLSYGSVCLSIYLFPFLF